MRREAPGPAAESKPAKAQGNVLVAVALKHQAGQEGMLGRHQQYLQRAHILYNEGLLLQRQISKQQAVGALLALLKANMHMH